MTALIVALFWIILTHSMHVAEKITNRATLLYRHIARVLAG